MTEANNIEAVRIILTGWRMSGKSTLCRKIVEEARRAGWQVGGILTPAWMKGGMKMGFHALDLASGEQRLLASIQAGDVEPGWTMGPWHFSAPAFEWGESCFAQTFMPLDLWVVDELGPLELERGQGWQTALRRWESRIPRFSVAVIRPEYRMEFARHWPDALVMDTEENNVEAQLLHALGLPVRK